MNEPNQFSEDYDPEIVIKAIAMIQSLRQFNQNGISDLSWTLLSEMSRDDLVFALALSAMFLTAWIKAPDLDAQLQRFALKAATAFSASSG